MICYYLILTALIFCMETSAGASSLLHHVLHYEQSFGKSVYSVDITMNNDLKISYSNKIKIQCLTGCNSGNAYFDSPKANNFDGAFSRGNEIITLWSTNVNWIRIYHVNDGEIHKVLDEPSTFEPTFTITPDGKLEVVVRSDTAGDHINPYITENDRKELLNASVRAWVWDNNKYNLESDSRFR